MNLPPIATTYKQSMARDRRREELHVTVPTLFRCPISMDVMKSPVSLCTGVTYDRASIEKWLSLGHNTCPATMQILPSSHTTPNLTLRRLIHLWVSHAEIVQASSHAISKQQAADIINAEFDSHSLAKAIAFATSSEENLEFIAKSDRSISRLVEALAKSDDIRIREMVVEILDLISPVVGVGEKLNQLVLRIADGGEDWLPSLSMVLQKGNTKSKAKSAKLLELVASTSESQRRIAETPGLLHGLCSLTTVETDTSAVEAGFSALLAVSTTRPAKKELVRLGIAKTVGRILSGYDYSTPVSAVIQKALTVLAAVTTCTEGRGVIAEDEECVVGIVKRLIRCSGAATEHGIMVLWSVCCLARDSVAQENVARVDGLTKVLLVMQTDCSANTRQMCRELVKVVRAKCTKSNLGPCEIRTTCITPY